MSSVIRNITWTPYPSRPGERIGFIVDGNVTVRVAMTRDERRNPYRPEGGFITAMPITLELLFSVPASVDRVQHYSDQGEAERQAALALARFVGYCTK